MTQAQRDCDLACSRLVGFIEKFPGSRQAAIDHLNAMRADGTLPSPLAWAFDHAWYKPRATSRLSISTFNNWVGNKKKRGCYAPLKRQKDMSVKPWHPLAIALKQRPQGSHLTWISEQIESQWDESIWGSKPQDVYSVVYRFFHDKFSQIDQLKGRHKGSALSAHKFHHVRTNEGMLPWDEIHADGWNTHFTAPHPVTDEFVTYEVWHFHDVATRFVTAPGIGLTENFDVINAGIKHCIEFGGVMAILQTDSTKIVKDSDRLKLDPVTSLADRAGFTIKHPRVGNSQANGICENFNKYLDRRARELATYQARDMDSLTLKRVKKITEKMVKAHHAGELEEAARLRLEAGRMGKGYVFSSATDAVAWIRRVIDEHNDKPHRSLKKIHDPESGKKRHQTPREALHEHIQNGWEPVRLEAAHLADLFLAHVRKTVRREMVVPYGGMRYHHPELGDWNGKEVVVAYDRSDWAQVWVKTLQGELICVADFSEARRYRPQSEDEMAQEKRINAQIKRKQQQIETIEARAGGALLEHHSAPVIPMPVAPAIEGECVQASEPNERQEKPNLAAMGDYSRLAWLAEHPEDWTPEYRRYLDMKVKQGSRVIEEALEDFGLWGEIENFEVAAVSAN